MDAKYTILIVDDIDDNRYSLKKTLQKPEYAFIEAGDGATALQMVEERCPDLILLDVRMPGIDGFHVCETIRSQFKHVPIIFVTANMKDFASQAEGFDRGADDYFIQPYDAQELAIKVKTLLRNKKLYDELLTEIERLQQHKDELLNSNDTLKKINSDLAEKTEYLSSLTITDPLTSLYNKKYFHQRIQKEISAVKRYKHESCVTLVDVDRFTRINDTYGARQSDVLLKECASLLVNSVRNSDVVCRYDGGKFAVIFTHTPESNGLHKANLIREAVAAYPFPIYEDLLPPEKNIKTTAIQLSVTMVVAGLDHDWIETDVDLIKSLEISLRDAKAAGTNQVLTARRIH